MVFQVMMASEHGVPVVFEPLGVDKESQQSFSKPNADTTTPAPSPDTPNQASKPEPPSPPNTTQVSDTPTSQTQTPYEDPEIAPSRPNIPLTPFARPTPLHAPMAAFGGEEFYPDLVSKAAVTPPALWSGLQWRMGSRNPS